MSVSHLILCVKPHETLNISMTVAKYIFNLFAADKFCVFCIYLANSLRFFQIFLSGSHVTKANVLFKFVNKSLLLNE